MARRQHAAATAGFETFETEDGEVVFYDRENVNGWIATDTVIDFSDVRAAGPGE